MFIVVAERFMGFVDSKDNMDYCTPCPLSDICLALYF